MQQNSPFPPSSLTEEWKSFIAFLPNLENFLRKIWIAWATVVCPNEASSRMHVYVPCCKWSIVWPFYGYFSHYGDQVWITDLQPGTQFHSLATAFSPHFADVLSLIISFCRVQISGEITWKLGWLTEPWQQCFLMVGAVVWAVCWVGLEIFYKNLCICCYCNKSCCLQCFVPSLLADIFHLMKTITVFTS